MYSVKAIKAKKDAITYEEARYVAERLISLGYIGDRMGRERRTLNGVGTMLEVSGRLVVEYGWDAYAADTISYIVACILAELYPEL